MIYYVIAGTHKRAKAPTKVVTYTHVNKSKHYPYNSVKRGWLPAEVREAAE